MKWQFNPFTGKLDRIEIQAPASSTDNAMMRWSGTTADEAQNSLYHTITDAGNTLMRAVPNSFEAFQFRDAVNLTMMRLDTRAPADMVSGSSKYTLGGFGFGEGGAGLVGSNTAHTGINGSVVLGSGTQTGELIGMQGVYSGRGASISTISAQRAGRFEANWQSSGVANTLIGYENRIFVGSSSQATGLVTQAFGTTSQIGFFAGSQAAAISTGIGFLIQSPLNTDATHTIGTFQGLSIQDCKKTGVTNSHALNINAQSSGGFAIRTSDGKHQIGGGVTFKRVATATDYVTTVNDHIIAVTSTAVPRVIMLSTVSLGEGSTTAAFILTVKDESGGAAANNVTITTEGAELIDGAATAVINTNYGVVRVYSNGTNWFTI